MCSSNVTSDTSDVDTKTLPIIMKLFYTLNVSNNENFSLYSIKLNSLVEQCLRIYTKLIYLNDNEAHHIIAGVNEFFIKLIDDININYISAFSEFDYQHVSPQIHEQ